MKILQSLDFKDQELVSERKNLQKLQTLGEMSVQRIKQAFVEHNHPRFMKSFSYHLPFGMKKAYKQQIEQLNLEKLAHLIKICSFLMQTKAYLFWRKERH